HAMPGVKSGWMQLAIFLPAERVALNEQGIIGDRQLAVISEGEIITQLKLPGLAKIVPERIADHHLRLSAETYAAL
ncbi:MAG: hypothetical protein V7746_04230, partial [Halioglobus sp.]